MYKKASHIFSLALLLFAGWHVFVGLAMMPAFNQPRRLAVGLPPDQPLLRWSLFHQADYLYQSAYSTRFAAVDVITRSKDLQEALPPGRSFDNLRKAQRLVSASLRLTPADANGWMLLAQTEQALDNRAQAYTAYRNTIDLAPHNRANAVPRLIFAARLIAQNDGFNPDPKQIADDLCNQHLNTPDLRARFLAFYPELQPFSSEPGSCANGS